MILQQEDEIGPTMIAVDLVSHQINPIDRLVLIWFI
jgi:hypothetical protein